MVAARFAAGGFMIAEYRDWQGVYLWQLDTSFKPTYRQGRGSKKIVKIYVSYGFCSMFLAAAICWVHRWFGR